MKEQLSHILDKDILSIDFFTKGQIGDIYKVRTVNESYILKTSKSSTQLQIEADMLIDINKYKILVPEVYALSDDFYETKIPLYQIYPYLVHIALYGNTYVSGLKEQLKRLKV